MRELHRHDPISLPDNVLMHPDFPTDLLQDSNHADIYQARLVLEGRGLTEGVRVAEKPVQTMVGICHVSQEDRPMSLDSFSNMAGHRIFDTSDHQNKVMDQISEIKHPNLTIRPLLSSAKRGRYGLCRRSPRTRDNTRGGATPPGRQGEKETKHMIHLHAMILQSLWVPSWSYLL